MCLPCSKAWWLQIHTQPVLGNGYIEGRMLAPQGCKLLGLLPLLSFWRFMPGQVHSFAVLYLFMKALIMGWGPSTAATSILMPWLWHLLCQGLKPGGHIVQYSTCFWLAASTSKHAASLPSSGWVCAVEGLCWNSLRPLQGFHKHATSGCHLPPARLVHLSLGPSLFNGIPRGGEMLRFFSDAWTPV